MKKHKPIPPHSPRISMPLPMFPHEVEERGWDALDVLLITGDAYVDHPSFGAALIGRLLEREGLRIGIIAQPRWNTLVDIQRMGRPRLFVGITAGALDSMLAHYTAFRKLRHDDAYTPGNRHGARPNRACIVYAGLARQAFPGVPVILGGIESSLRRASHYDFWSDKIRRSILLDSKADCLVYGMGEQAVREIARRLSTHPENPRSVLSGIRGTAMAVSDVQSLIESNEIPDEKNSIQLPSHEDILQDKHKLMTASLLLERQTHQAVDWAYQSCGTRLVAFAPPALPLSTGELDALYQMPFTRQPHPSYALPIPAASMVQFSLTAHRGCAAACTFCSISLHQGRQVQSRSASSIVQEVKSLVEHPDWKGSISDVGGPTANMWGAQCKGTPSACRRSDCLFPKRCPHFKTKYPVLIALLNEIKAIQKVKHVRVASGIRYDLRDDDNAYFQNLIRHFVGGQLKAAPEHISRHVLQNMRKPDLECFESFLALFEKESKYSGKKQYVVPYLISAFPGCTENDMKELARWLDTRGWKPQQVQCFIPTPGTVATAMFHAGVDVNGNPIYIARSDRERLKQHRIIAPDSKRNKTKT